MKTSTNYGIRVLATGIMVLVFFAIPLYWGRLFSDLALRGRMPAEATRIEISPSGLLPEAIENDPNVDRHSQAVASMDEVTLPYTFGFIHYFTSRMPGGDRSDVFYYSQDGGQMYFDRAAGQIVFRDTYRKQREGRPDVEQQTPTFYAGPDGISQSPGENLGRFLDPALAPVGQGRHVVYDCKLHRVYAIDREAMKVTAGPDLTGLDMREPLVFSANRYPVQLSWWAPSRRVLEESQEQGTSPRYRYRYTIRFESGGYWSRYAPAVDASGRIVLLDAQTLEIILGKGLLPVPKTLYGEGSRRPSQLLGFEVMPISIGDDHEYTGLIATAVSRQGTSMGLLAIDKNGVVVASADTRALPYSEKAQIASIVTDTSDPAPRDLTARRSPWIKSARAALFQVPWSPAVTLFRYLLENVHPPILTMTSFFVANRIEAGASHRALFLVPNSFAAMQRDARDQSIVLQFFGALFMILPAILLVVFLAWRVARDAAALGLSNGTRSLWLLGTLAFGLPAYITYRMTRPAGGLVTCATCGKVRRCDMERCHLCGGAWETPELNPPAWRVFDEGAESSEPLPGSEKSSDAGELKTDLSVESM